MYIFAETNNMIMEEKDSFWTMIKGFVSGAFVFSVIVGFCILMFWIVMQIMGYKL